MLNWKRVDQRETALASTTSHRDHEEATTPHVVPQEAHAAVSAGDNRQTPAKLTEAMSSTPRPVPTPGCAESSDFFSDGEKC